MRISASSWFVCWIGMELNLLSFIAMMRGEVAAIYFLAQVTGSALFLLGPIMGELGWRSAGVVLLLGLFVKMGSVPAYFWFPAVLRGLSWGAGFILLTWQKLGPVVLCGVGSINEVGLFLILGLANTVVGGLGGLNQTQLRPILGYSSISHLG